MAKTKLQLMEQARPQLQGIKRRRLVTRGAVDDVVLRLRTLAKDIESPRCAEETLDRLISMPPEIWPHVLRHMTDQDLLHLEDQISDKLFHKLSHMLALGPKMVGPHEEAREWVVRISEFGKEVRRAYRLASPTVRNFVNL